MSPLPPACPPIALPDRPWQDVATVWRHRFGGPTVRVLVDVGWPCHRLREGDGCTFCAGDAGGSRGRQAGPVDPPLVQFQTGLAARRARRPGLLAIPYLFRGTSTALPASGIRDLVRPLLDAEGTVALALSARPDPIPADTRAILAEMAAHRPLVLEMGLQSAHDATLRRLNRGHTWDGFRRAVEEAAAIPGVEVVAHLILGLPGESRRQMLDTADRVAGLPVTGVKLHHLQVLRHAPLAEEWRAGRVPTLEESAYPALLADVLERLPAGVAVHRLRADAPVDWVLAPLWTIDKRTLAERLRAEFQRRRSTQGSRVGGQP